MATAGDGSVSYKNGGAGEKSRKRPFRTEALMWPENNEEPQNISQEAERNDSTGVVAYEGGNSADTLISELELMLKQKMFTRSETERLIAVLRTIEESPSSLLSLEASKTSVSLKKRKHGDESDNFHNVVVSSRVAKEEIASLNELAYTYEDRTIVTCQLLGQELKFMNNNATCLLKTPMDSPQHPTTIDNLPNELSVNIFIRLYAKQLAQMRSVSKSWNALLSQSTFVKSHLHRSIQYNDQIHLHFNESSSGFQSFTAQPCRSALLQLPNFIKPPDNTEFECKYIRVIGSVNGLICSSYRYSVFHIWNPSLSAVLTLPPYSMPSDGHESLLISFRFGFDPKTDDYKVIKLTGLTGEIKNVVEWWLEVEIYSMRKGTWELITEKFPSHIRVILDDDNMCVDGHNGLLHWRCYSGEGDNTKTIVAFDLGSQTFREMPFPDSTLDINMDDRYNYLGVLAGKLCLMSRNEDDVIEVWVMEEYGVTESWVKRHVFSQFSGDTYPFGFTSHNEFLIEDIHGRLVFYDPIANKSKIVESYCLEEYAGDAGKFVEYVDSLVWVAPAEPEMVDGAGRN